MLESEAQYLNQIQIDTWIKDRSILESEADQYLNQIPIDTWLRGRSVLESDSDWYLNQRQIDTWIRGRSVLESKADYDSWHQKMLLLGDNSWGHWPPHRMHFVVCCYSNHMSKVPCSLGLGIGSRWSQRPRCQPELCWGTVWWSGEPKRQWSRHRHNQRSVDT